MKKFICLLILLAATNVYANCSNNVKVENDTFAKKITITTDTCKSGDYNEGYLINYFVSVQKNSYSLVLSVMYSDRTWRYYTHAQDENGVKYSSSVQREVLSCRNGCTYNEAIIINLTESQINQFAKKDLKIRFDSPGTGKHMMFDIKSSQVQEFIKVYKENYK
jgi:hypothetical protein